MSSGFSRGGRAFSLMKEIMASGVRCPAHSNCTGHSHGGHGSSLIRASAASPSFQGKSMTSMSSETLKEYAVEMACSNVRFGFGVSAEIGMDVNNMKAKRALLITDKTVAALPAFNTILDSLASHRVNFDLFDDVSIEPTNESLDRAVAFARASPYDIFLAVGGGSVMDTCKVANLFSVYREAELLDFAARPIGKGQLVERPLFPLIAVPTTAGTGSETTGVAVFDYKPMRAKIGIGSRAIRPTLGLIDPVYMSTMPATVTAYSGFDVLCHALESYTALPYTERTPRPGNPAERPAYQGSNPISDVWSRHALSVIAKYFRRAYHTSDDFEARSNMHLASCFAGIGFGNAGVHLCHGMSYPIAGLVPAETYAAGYPRDKPIIPHGLSVVLSAPAVFRFTAPLCPERHLEAAGILQPGLDVSRARREDAGEILADVVRGYMSDLDIPNGLSALGFHTEDIPALVRGSLPQERVIKLSPRATGAEDLEQLFVSSMAVY